MKFDFYKDFKFNLILSHIISATSSSFLFFSFASRSTSERQVVLPRPVVLLPCIFQKIAYLQCLYDFQRLHNSGINWWKRKAVWKIMVVLWASNKDTLTQIAKKLHIIPISTKLVQNQHLSVIKATRQIRSWWRRSRVEKSQRPTLTPKTFL